MRENFTRGSVRGESGDRFLYRDVCDDEQPEVTDSLGTVRWAIQFRDDNLCEVRLAKPGDVLGISAIVSSSFCERKWQEGKFVGTITAQATYEWEKEETMTVIQEGQPEQGHYECKDDLLKHDRFTNFLRNAAGGKNFIRYYQTGYVEDSIYSPVQQQEVTMSYSHYVDTEYEYVTLPDNWWDESTCRERRYSDLQLVETTKTWDYYGNPDYVVVGPDEDVLTIDYKYRCYEPYQHDIVLDEYLEDCRDCDLEGGTSCYFLSESIYWEKTQGSPIHWKDPQYWEYLNRSIVSAFRFFSL